MVEADRLEHCGSYPEALAILEIAINEALTNGPTLLLAMAYEQAGKLVSKWTRSQFLSGTFLAGAHQTYKELGASAKCSQMESVCSLPNEARVAIPTPIGIPSPAGSRSMGSVRSDTSTSGSGSTSSNDSVDLATILSAVSTWQRENSAARVAASLIGILMKSMVWYGSCFSFDNNSHPLIVQGARYGALALMSKDGILRLSVAGTLDDLRSDLVRQLSSHALSSSSLYLVTQHIAIEQGGEIAPTSLINYAVRTRKVSILIFSVFYIIDNGRVLGDSRSCQC